MRRLWVALFAAAALALAPAAAANPPALTAVGATDLHPTATFSAPQAEDVTIYLASSPARATDGGFLQENIADVDFLTTSEIQTGQWEYQDQVNPGTYYVMIDADADPETCLLDDGSIDPSCADGYSDMLTLDVPEPPIRYRVTATVESFLSAISLQLTATPLGVNTPYKVCYPTITGKKLCLSRTLDGFDWTQSGSDTVSVSTARLGKTTTFTWYVAGKPVATKTVRR